MNFKINTVFLRKNPYEEAPLGKYRGFTENFRFRLIRFVSFEVVTLCTEFNALTWIFSSSS